MKKRFIPAFHHRVLCLLSGLSLGLMACAQQGQAASGGTGAQALRTQALSNSGQVCFYADANYAGTSFCASGDSGWVGTDWNDKISSLKVQSGYQVVLFSDVNYGGTSKTFTGDVSFVGTDFNDKASSFKVLAQSQTGQTGSPAQRDTAGMNRLIQLFSVSNNTWTKGLTMDAIINSYERTHDPKYRTLIDQSFQYGQGWRSGDANKLYFDDMGWYANAWLRAYDVTGDRKFLTEAQAIFKDMTTAWDGTCGGGLWWNSDRQYKNAITNELFLLIAARLDRRSPNGTGSGSYHDWAMREWNWFKQSGMINAWYGVNDGLDSNCRNNNGPTFSYNQGIILGGLVELWRISGDRGYLTEAERIAENTINNQVYPGGILKEPGGTEDPCAPEGDGTMFKSAFVQGLARLYNAERSNKPQYLTFLRNNADSVWNKSRDAYNTLGFNWAGPAGCPNKTSHASAMMVVGQVALLEVGGETSTVPR